jgi:transcriptional regulator of arginine metabolism
MRNKNNRLDAIKLIISTKDVSSQEELLAELKKVGYELTQATLSRDLKQLKVAKASSSNGNYAYVLPNNTMYRRVGSVTIADGIVQTGFISINFSGNIAVIKTKPGYASRLAFDIDNNNLDTILGTVAGDDTIIMVLRQDVVPHDIIDDLEEIIPDMQLLKNIL